MPTFAGQYVQEPSDFATVTTEAGLLQIADDPENPVVLADVVAWADLSNEQKATLKALLDTLILRKEGIIDGYLRAGGYATPADVDANPIILNYAIDLVWNDLQRRKEQISAEEYRHANAAVFDQLSLIASGDMLLAMPEATGDSAPTGTVYAASSAERIFSRDTLKDF